MATTAGKEELLWQEIRETKKKRDAVEAELESAQGAEKERLQLRVIELEGQLKAYATAISKLPAVSGMLRCEPSVCVCMHMRAIPIRRCHVGRCYWRALL